MYRKSGFTLVELLIVIGIIAVLLAVLLPALHRARESARTVQCMSNLKQLVVASISYVADNDGMLPGPNWPGKDVAGVAGWLYRAPLQGPPGVESQHQTGTIYPYLHNDTVYHCPVDDGPYIAGPAQWLSSYTMNGAVIGYSGPETIPFRYTRMPGGAVAFWECGDMGDVPPNFTGGSSTPDAGQSTRHRDGGAVGFFDGHVEWWTRAQYANEKALQPGRLWCNPQVPSGIAG